MLSVFSSLEHKTSTFHRSMTSFLAALQSVSDETHRQVLEEAVHRDGNNRLFNEYPHLALAEFIKEKKVDKQPITSILEMLNSTSASGRDKIRHKELFEQLSVAYAYYQQQTRYHCFDSYFVKQEAVFRGFTDAYFRDLTFQELFQASFMRKRLGSLVFEEKLKILAKTQKALQHGSLLDSMTREAKTELYRQQHLQKSLISVPFRRSERHVNAVLEEVGSCLNKWKRMQELMVAEHRTADVQNGLDTLASCRETLQTEIQALKGAEAKLNTRKPLEPLLEKRIQNELRDWEDSLQDRQLADVDIQEKLQEWHDDRLEVTEREAAMMNYLKSGIDREKAAMVDSLASTRLEQQSSHYEQVLERFQIHLRSIADGIVALHPLYDILRKQQQIPKIPKTMNFKDCEKQLEEWGDQCVENDYSRYSVRLTETLKNISNRKEQMKVIEGQMKKRNDSPGTAACQFLENILVKEIEDRATAALRKQLQYQMNLYMELDSQLQIVCRSCRKSASDLQSKMHSQFIAFFTAFNKDCCKKLESVSKETKIGNEEKNQELKSLAEEQLRSSLEQYIAWKESAMNPERAEVQQYIEEALGEMRHVLGQSTATVSDFAMLAWLIACSQLLLSYQVMVLK
jgi:hypothetical protein